MPTFRVVVHGRGLVVRRWWVFRRHVGFFATEFVDAESRVAAESLALDQVRSAPRLLLAALRPPSLAIDDVQEVTGPASTCPRLGIVFYPRESEADDRPVT